MLDNSRTKPSSRSIHGAQAKFLMQCKVHAQMKDTKYSVKVATGMKKDEDDVTEVVPVQCMLSVNVLPKKQQMGAASTLQRQCIAWLTTLLLLLFAGTIFCEFLRFRKKSQK